MLLVLDNGTITMWADSCSSHLLPWKNLEENGRIWKKMVEYGRIIHGLLYLLTVSIGVHELSIYSFSYSIFYILFTQSFLVRVHLELD